MKDKIAVDPKTGCHIWNGAKSSGYGVIWLDGKMVQVTHVVYELHIGTKVPEGMEVCHHCDNPPCVNPDHFFLGTRKDNIQDCVQKGRHRPSFVNGEKHGRVKLTTEKVIQIRASSNPQKQLAKQYGVSQQLISRIKRREIWMNH